jgi:hypothetical protein
MLRPARRRPGKVCRHAVIDNGTPLTTFERHDRRRKDTAPQNLNGFANGAARKAKTHGSQGLGFSISVTIQPCCQGRTGALA